MRACPGCEESTRHRGFSLPELLVATSIFLLLSALAFSLTRNATEREEIQAVTVGLASWLEGGQEGAKRTTAGCTVTVSSGSSLATGSALATVQPSTCTTPSSYRLGSEGFSSSLSLTISSTPAVNSLVFTPRGTVTLINDMILSLRKSGGDLTGCLRISGTSGMVTTAAVTSPNTCADAKFGDSM